MFIHGNGKRDREMGEKVGRGEECQVENVKC